MRILFTTYSHRTHLFSMVPLAWALRGAGHEVAFACQPRFAADVAGTGLTAVPVGRRGTSWHRLAEANPGHSPGGLPAPYDAAVRPPEEASWTAMHDGYRFMIALWHKVNNFPLMDGLVELARSWRPDLVVWEPTTHAGALAAAACGAAHARLNWSIDVFAVTRQRFLAAAAARPAGTAADPLADWLGGYARRYGLEFTEDLVDGQFTIDQLPASLRMEAPGRDYLPVQYVPYGGSAAVPAWLREPPRRPRVAVTLGTTAVEASAGYSLDLREVLHAVARPGVEVVATVADPQRGRLGRVPDGVRVVPYVPLDALAPTCSAVVDHAGPGTFLTTARHGVPQLTVPWDFDEPELARRAAAQGGSLTLAGHEATGAAVRDGVDRLLHEPGLRGGAERLREEIRALPTPNRLVAQLEERAAGHRAAAGRAGR